MFTEFLLPRSIRGRYLLYQCGLSRIVNPLTPTVAICVQLSPERQSARMSKFTNDGLTRSCTGCFIAVPIMATVGVKGLKWLVVVLSL